MSIEHPTIFHLTPVIIFFLYIPFLTNTISYRTFYLTPWIQKKKPVIVYGVCSRYVHKSGLLKKKNKYPLE